MHQFPEITAVRRGPRLFAWRMGPAGPSVRTLLLVHGAGEHSSRYFALAQLAVERGWQVIGFDLRGHGCSEGVSVHIRRFSDYWEDLVRVVEHFQIDLKRTAVLAHSLGGLITVSACQHKMIEPAAVALSCPLLRLRANVPLWKLAAGRTVKRAWPTTRFKSTVKPKHLLRDADLLEKREADPLISRTLTAGWFFSVMRQANRIWNMPYETLTRLVQGTADRVVDPQGAVEWLRRGDVHATEGRFVAGGLHEVFHDFDGAELFAEQLDWFERRIPEFPAVLPFPAPQLATETVVDTGTVLSREARRVIRRAA